MEKPKDFADLTILVVDDNDSTRELVRKLLQSLGVKTVIEAANGLDALNVLGRNAVHAILCDIKMAPINGIEFVRKLRTGDLPPSQIGLLAVNRTVPVIMLTAHTVKPLVEQARKVGANGFLAKPVNPKLLRERLDVVVLRRAPSSD